MMMVKLVELLAGETEVLGENLPQCRFVHRKHRMLPGCEPGPPWWEASDYPLELRHGLYTCMFMYWTLRQIKVFIGKNFHFKLKKALSSY
jgi:hypothetical protein